MTLQNAQAVVSVRQEYSEDSEKLIDIFRLEHKQYGDYDLWVKDTEKYLWFGPYSTGKLAVYQAVISPVNKMSEQEVLGLIFSYHDMHDSYLSAAGAMVYPAVINPRTSLGFFLDHVMRAITESQAVVLAKQVSDGKVSIH